MNKEAAPHLNARETLDMVNRSVETGYKRLYQVDRPVLTRAVFVETMENDPETLSMWFNLIEEAADNDAETAKTKLLKKVGEAEWKIASFMNMLPYERQKELDERVNQINKTVRRSRIGLVGALMRHRLITDEMIGADGVIRIPVDQRTGLLEYVHNFRLSDRSLKRIEQRKKELLLHTGIVVYPPPMQLSETIPDEITETGIGGLAGRIHTIRHRIEKVFSQNAGKPQPAPEF